MPEVQVKLLEPRWHVHTVSRHFPDLEFTPSWHWTRRGALAYIRHQRASIGHLIFRYELEDRRTGKRVPV
jgi:hypothetical protein